MHWKVILNQTQYNIPLLFKLQTLNQLTTEICNNIACRAVNYLYFLILYLANNKVIPHACVLSTFSSRGQVVLLKCNPSYHYLAPIKSI